MTFVPVYGVYGGVSYGRWKFCERHATERRHAGSLMHLIGEQEPGEQGCDDCCDPNEGVRWDG